MDQGIAWTDLPRGAQFVGAVSLFGHGNGVSVLKVVTSLPGKPLPSGLEGLKSPAAMQRQQARAREEMYDLKAAARARKLIARATAARAAASTPRVLDKGADLQVSGGDKIKAVKTKTGW